MYVKLSFAPKSTIIFATLLCFIDATRSSVQAQERHTVEGNQLVVQVDEESSVDLSKEPPHNYLFDFTEILASNPNVNTIVLTGEGGYEGIADGYIEVISEQKLNTVARGECVSSCAHIFLAGHKRTFQQDAVIGFHRSWWAEAELQWYFDNNGGKSRFENQFQFAQHIFEEGQDYTMEKLTYFLEAGLPIDFVKQVFSTPSYEMIILTADEFYALVTPD